LAEAQLKALQIKLDVEIENRKKLESELELLKKAKEEGN